ncbi:hypothetical protein QFZ42_003304 [Variovorax paradoxus]|uniref:DUF7940 domain-containing protein n=1 Tax=Variovorax paradoxus TaxID=34073 RepID=UPI002794403B|nr:hypothetical protein [Variovorax paradoxus]MDQ0571470.1 hypothetical protein [Variovorax paradoxus]
MKLVDNWRKLWRSWTVMLASAGIFLPDILQIVAENIDGVPLIDTGHKSLIRLACLIAIVLLRPVKQESLTK